MKNAIFLLCCYLTLLMAWPTLRVLKQHFNESCSKNCCESASRTSPKHGNSGCQKEKCIFNRNVTMGQYLIQPIEHITFHDNHVFIIKKALEYRENYSSKYKVSIWHPPKNYLLS